VDTDFSAGGRVAALPIDSLWYNRCGGGVMAISQSTVRLSGLDRENIRRIMAHIRRMNREAGISSPVSQNDAIQFALHYLARELEAGRVEGQADD